MPGFDPGLLRWALANHTRRDGYWLALSHGRGDRRYELDSQLVGSVTPEERAEAQQRLEASTQRGQAKAARVREHNEWEEQRRQQCARARRHREAKAARKAEHERRQQEIAARKAALAAQGILVESRVVSRPHPPTRRRTSRADAGSPRTHAGPASAAGRVQEETPVCTKKSRPNEQMIA